MGASIEPDEALKYLEMLVINICLDEMRTLLHKASQGEFLNGKKLEHLSEMVKLAHQVRSLLK